MARRILPTLATFALVAALSGCGGGGEGSVTTPPPDLGGGGVSDNGGASDDGGGSPNGSSDGGGDEQAAVPDIPAPDPVDYPGMDEQTPEGAEQALRYFVEMIFWGYQTGETSELEGRFEESCGTCRENLESIDDLTEQGEFWSMTSTEEIDVWHEDADDEYDAVIGLVLVLSEHTEPGAQGSEMQEVGALRHSFGAGLNWSDGKWKIAGLSVVVEDE